MLHLPLGAFVQSQAQGHIREAAEPASFPTCFTLAVESSASLHHDILLICISIIRYISYLSYILFEKIENRYGEFYSATIHNRDEINGNSYDPLSARI